ncbi:hypothetical protein A2870_01355 [Candidatus Curtissbacteria bacterium RIFCSPHIGHO2_01_FULL_41_11]|uniref:Uncharacterized protein n=1 Tax=Candidatus Curtissbacteria bacterium RIFCSPHIGHO2_01_FULL_41_11 TaxID=1797711 RepID=A0A1F5G6C5_9BACT|nr:MAG: hypothetical protein A2870_01355 [Candidatus Curtissbacteria bacterium RIFCSPHIGHO2_01_FULL_41_11]
MSPEPLFQRPEIKERTIEGTCKTCFRPLVVIVGNLDEQTIISKLKEPRVSLGCSSWHIQAETPLEGFDWNLTPQELTYQEIFVLNRRGPMSTSS